jgi:hypothetical protein
MKKRLLKFTILPMIVLLITLFVIPSFAYAFLDLNGAIDAPGGSSYDLSYTNSNQVAIFSSFGSITPKQGGNFIYFSTGNAQKNKDGTSSSTSYGGSQDNVDYTLKNITVPAGKHGFTFNLYSISAEALNSPENYDYLEVKIFGSTASGFPDGTVIAHVGNHDLKNAGSELNGTAFAGHIDRGWGTAGASVNPGDNIKIEFYLTDTLDNSVDTAAILDNFQFKTSSVSKGVVWESSAKKSSKKEAAEAEPIFIRTMPMTCYQVWINSDNKFEMVFWYPYADNNWVKIYDMSGKQVYSVDMPLDDPHIIVDLPNGMYTVKTFNDQPEPLQTFIIGK